LVISKLTNDIYYAQCPSKKKTSLNIRVYKIATQHLYNKHTVSIVLLRI